MDIRLNPFERGKVSQGIGNYALGYLWAMKTPGTLESVSNVRVTESSRDFNLPAHSQSLSLSRPLCLSFSFIFLVLTLAVYARYWNLILTVDSRWRVCVKNTSNHFTTS